MRLLFLCSSLEPGRDGGGRLQPAAGAGMRPSSGMPARSIALNDPHVPEDSRRVRRSPTGSPRCDCPPNADIARAVAFREQLRARLDQPAARGLRPESEGRSLQGHRRNCRPSSVGDIPLHLMLHEALAGQRCRHRACATALVGWLQKSSLQRHAGHVAARDLIATTNPVYAALLKTIGVEADILPLFGNIPISVCEPLARAAIAAQLQPAPGKRGSAFSSADSIANGSPSPSSAASNARGGARREKAWGSSQIGKAGGEGDVRSGRKLERGLCRDLQFRFLKLGPQPAPRRSPR